MSGKTTTVQVTGLLPMHFGATPSYVGKHTPKAKMLCPKCKIGSVVARPEGLSAGELPFYTLHLYPVAGHPQPGNPELFALAADFKNLGQDVPVFRCIDCGYAYNAEGEFHQGCCDGFTINPVDGLGKPLGSDAPTPEEAHLIPVGMVPIAEALQLLSIQKRYEPHRAQLGMASAYVEWLEDEVKRLRNLHNDHEGAPLPAELDLAESLYLMPSPPQENPLPNDDPHPTKTSTLATMVKHLVAKVYPGKEPTPDSMKKAVHNLMSLEMQFGHVAKLEHNGHHAFSTFKQDYGFLINALATTPTGVHSVDFKLNLMSTDTVVVKAVESSVGKVEEFLKQKGLILDGDWKEQLHGYLSPFVEQNPLINKATLVSIDAMPAPVASKGASVIFTFGFSTVAPKDPSFKTKQPLDLHISLPGTYDALPMGWPAVTGAVLHKKALIDGKYPSSLAYPPIVLQPGPKKVGLTTLTDTTNDKASMAAIVLDYVEGIAEGYRVAGISKKDLLVALAGWEGNLGVLETEVTAIFQKTPKAPPHLRLKMKIKGKPLVTTVTFVLIPLATLPTVEATKVADKVVAALPMSLQKYAMAISDPIEKDVADTLETLLTTHNGLLVDLQVAESFPKMALSVPGSVEATVMFVAHLVHKENGMHSKMEFKGVYPLHHITHA